MGDRLSAAMDALQVGEDVRDPWEEMMDAMSGTDSTGGADLTGVADLTGETESVETTDTAGAGWDSETDEPWVLHAGAAWAEHAAAAWTEEAEAAWALAENDNPGWRWPAVTTRLAQAPAPVVNFSSTADFMARWQTLLNEYSALVHRALMQQVEGGAVRGMRRLVWTQYDLLLHGMADLALVRRRGLPLLLQATGGAGVAWCTRANEAVIDAVTTASRTYMDTMRHHEVEPDVHFLVSCCEIEARSRLGGVALCADGLPIYTVHAGIVQELIDSSFLVLRVAGEVVLFVPRGVWTQHASSASARCPRFPWPQLFWHTRHIWHTCPSSTRKQQTQNSIPPRPRPRPVA